MPHPTSLGFWEPAPGRARVRQKEAGRGLGEVAPVGWHAAGAGRSMLFLIEVPLDVPALVVDVALVAHIRRPRLPEG